MRQQPAARGFHPGAGRRGQGPLQEHGPLHATPAAEGAIEFARRAAQLSGQPGCRFADEVELGDKSINPGPEHGVEIESIGLDAIHASIRTRGPVPQPGDRLFQPAGQHRDRWYTGTPALLVPQQPSFEDRVRGLIRRLTHLAVPAGAALVLPPQRATRGFKPENALGNVAASEPLALSVRTEPLSMSCPCRPELAGSMKKGQSWRACGRFPDVFRVKWSRRCRQTLESQPESS